MGRFLFIYVHVACFQQVHASMHAANSTDNIHISSQEISCCRMCIAIMSGGLVYMQYCMSLKKVPDGFYNDL